MKRFEFIRAERQNYRIAKLCEAKQVTKQGFYAWDKRGESKRAKRRRETSVLVEKEYYDNKRILGATKIAKNLSTTEKPVNRKLVASIMKEKHLKSRVAKKYKATTNSKHNLPVAENILNREFTAELPNQKWVSDITYIATDEGWLYLAGILDLCGKDIAGWSMSERMTRELVLRCFNNAQKQRGNPKNVLLHSDRGSQYCSNDYQKALKENDFICSMSRKGNCWDNAPMESFWGKLKQEWLNDKHFRTRDEARAAVFWYIEVFYQRKRPHASNGYKTPFAYSAEALKKAANF